MLKRRIIGSITLKDNWVVQSINFNKYLPVGRLKYSVDFLDRWGIDEILVLDINASKSGYTPNYKLIKESTIDINVPLTVGGGIQNVSDMIGDLLFVQNRMPFAKYDEKVQKYKEEKKELDEKILKKVLTLT